MKVLTFNYEYPPLGGGGGVVHQQIVEQLAQRHEVAVVTSGFRTLPSHETVGGVEVFRVPVVGRKSEAVASLTSMLSYYPASLRKGQQVIDDFQPDVINTHFAVPTGPSAVRLARRNRVPHILCVHGGDVYDPSKLLSPHRTPGLRQAARWAIHRSDRVVAQSENTAQNVRRYFGFAADITIIPHGLKKQAFTPVERSALGLHDDQVVVINVGRLVRRKANHQLIEMLAANSNPRVVLVLLGEGPERDRLETLARRLGVANQVLMPGFVSEQRKMQLLNAADVFASTSSHEGFGLMFIEAMSCALPIVSYDNGGHRDFLRNGQTGFLARIDDRRAYQTALKRLVHDSPLRESMGRHNQRLSEDFAIERCAAQYESVFQEAAVATSGRPCRAAG